MANTDSQPLTLRRILLVIATGVGAGFLSGLFEVGGGLAGSQIGVWLLRRLPAPALPWILIGFTVFVIVSQYLHVPTRDGVVTLTPASCAWTVLVGLCAGILSGLVGVGGGSVIVPGMELAASPALSPTCATAWSTCASASLSARPPRPRPPPDASSPRSCPRASARSSSTSSC